MLDPEAPTRLPWNQLRLEGSGNGDRPVHARMKGLVGLFEALSNESVEARDENHLDVHLDEGAATRCRVPLARPKLQALFPFRRVLRVGASASAALFEAHGFRNVAETVRKKRAFEVPPAFAAHCSAVAPTVVAVTIAPDALLQSKRSIGVGSFVSLTVPPTSPICAQVLTIDVLPDHAAARERNPTCAFPPVTLVRPRASSPALRDAVFKGHRFALRGASSSSFACGVTLAEPVALPNASVAEFVSVAFADLDRFSETVQTPSLVHLRLVRCSWVEAIGSLNAVSGSRIAFALGGAPSLKTLDLEIAFYDHEHPPNHYECSVCRMRGGNTSLYVLDEMLSSIVETSEDKRPTHPSLQHVRVAVPWHHARGGRGFENDLDTLFWFVNSWIDRIANGQVPSQFGGQLRSVTLSRVLPFADKNTKALFASKMRTFNERLKQVQVKLAVASASERNPDEWWASHAACACPACATLSTKEARGFVAE